MNNERKPLNIFSCLIWSIVGATVSGFLFATVVTGFSLQFLAALPIWAGIITPITAEDVIHLAHLPNQNEIEFTKVGKYTIFAPTRSSTPSDVQIESITTGEPVEVYPREYQVEYETDFIKGKPIIDFEITQPGIYRLSVRGASISTWLIAPDYTTRNQVALALFYALPLLFIFGGGLGIWRWQERKSLASVRAKAQEKSQKWDEWMKTQDNK